jgi:hypothetical protein
MIFSEHGGNLAFISAWVLLLGAPIRISIEPHPNYAGTNPNAKRVGIVSGVSVRLASFFSPVHAAEERPGFKRRLPAHTRGQFWIHPYMGRGWHIHEHYPWIGF